MVQAMKPTPPIFFHPAEGNFMGRDKAEHKSFEWLQQQFTDQQNKTIQRHGQSPKTTRPRCRPG